MKRQIRDALRAGAGPAGVGPRGLALGACLALAAAALGGGSGDNVLLIIDPARPEALYVGNYYRAARNVPEQNVLYVDPSAADYARFTGANLDALFGTLANRSIGDHADFIVIANVPAFYVPAPNLVLDDCSPVRRFALTSVYVMAFIKDEILGGSVPVTLRNEYYSVSSEPRSFDSSYKWNDGRRENTSDARRYFIGALLGYSGSRGNTVGETLAMIDRSVAQDGTHPAGTYYFMDNQQDSARNVRANQYDDAVADIIALGGQAEKIAGVLPLGRHDCLGIMTGAATLDIDGGDFTILGGAFCDHLTSYAATFDVSSQTKLSRWIVKGACGSAGAVEEPCNYIGKFPRANLHTLYFQGMNLGECYFRSAQYVPFQILLYGDPLTQPFADIPVVTVDDPPGGVVSGTIQFSASAASPDPNKGIARLDLLVDGVVRDSIANGGTFTLDTTQLPDGHHDLRIAAFDDTRVTASGRWFGTLVTDNDGKSVTLTPTSPVSGNLTTPFSFDLDAAGGQVVELRIVQNSRVVAATSAPPPAGLTVFGRNLGAGPVRVFGEALFSDGSSARSDWVSLEIADAADTPSGAPPTAFDFSTRVRADSPFVVELPATFDDELSSASYALVSQPAQATVYPGSGPYRVMVPQQGARGTDTFSFRVQTVSGQSRVATVTITYQATCDPCDMNCDGAVDASDIQPFIDRLFADADPCCGARGEPGHSGDTNGDGSANASDIPGFIACLFP